MSKAHAKLSASGSATWLNCPGSVKAQEPYPNKSTSFAIEGTFAHELADICLSVGDDTDIYIGEKIKIKEKGETLYHVVDKEMADNVQEYLDYVRSFETKDSVLYTENRVDFSHVVPGGFGTLDSAVYLPKSNVLHIFDLKYGKGEPVEAFKNTQGMMYAIGMLNGYDGLEDFDNIIIHIVQPRIPNYSFYEISKNELLEWSKYVEKQANIALSDNAPRNPGKKQCRWCRAKPDCKALAKHTLEAIKSDFDDLEPVDKEKSLSMTDIEKSYVLDNADLIVDFLNSVKESVFNKLMNGEDFPNYKIVEGRANRNITEEGEKFLINTYGEKAFNKKLIGVGDAEKLAGKKEMSQYLHKPLGKPTLVHISDKRPPFSEARKSDIVKDFS